jgi:site-specific recombinase XerC
MTAFGPRKTKQRETKMTKQSETVAPKSKTWTPPRGIRLYPVPGRPLRPYGVQWRILNEAGESETRSKTFPTSGAQIDFAKALAGELRRSGAAGLRLADDREIRDWRAFQSEIAPATLAEVLSCWKRHGAIASQMTVADAVAAFLHAKKAEGVSRGSLGHFRPLFANVAAAFKDRNVGTIERAELEKYVAQIDGANETKRTVHKRIRSFFKWLAETRQIRVNPCDGWRGPKRIATTIDVLAVSDGRALFERNLDQPRELLGRLALEAFSGVRHETAQRLGASCFDFRNRVITIPAEFDKNRREQFIEHAPACLWAWLAWSDPASWTMNPRAYQEQKGLAFVRAGVKNPGNVLRHSAATYYLAMTGDAGKTAALLTHANLKMLWSNYRGKGGGEANGIAWFEVFPPAEAGAFPWLTLAQIVPPVEQPAIAA